MNTLFGIFFRSDSKHDPLSVQSMLQRMAACSTAESITWNDSHCGLGQSDYACALDNQGPPVSIMDREQNGALVCSARLDNRAEISAMLGLSSIGLEDFTDCELIRRAYCQWGERCSERLYGDWSFAVWHPKEHRLFLARDHFGITSLYYYADQNIFAFATSSQALLALKLSPIKMDELYLAQVLTSWPAYHGERTINTLIRRLPPAHRLAVTPGRIDIHQYWFLERTPLLQLPRREDYVEAFSELFDDAVKARLRTVDSSGGIATTLSGGLDSSSVTATAAGFLAAEGRRVNAYTSIPLYDTTRYVNGRFGDEYPLAEATARFSGNVDITTVDAAACTPVQAIRRMLQIKNEPEHAAGNFYWILELLKKAQIDDNKVVLLGQFGNAGISWTGDVFSQPALFQLRQLGWQKWSKETLKRNIPISILAALRRKRANPHLHYRASAINPSFANRLQLFEQRFNDSYDKPLRKGQELRSYLQPGRCMVGALHAELGAAFGLEVRDPTADARVLAFTFSVPDHLFMDPKTGMDRMLIREAMKGRLPEEVRLNRNRGRQAGDLVPRLRACASEVETALNELARGPAAEYVDVPYMRQVWQMIQTQDTPEAFQKSGTILTRGIMAGLFVNGFYDGTKRVP